MAPADPLVSVITPVFNGAAYLQQCIQSVLAQSFENFEYFIVDNCSTDESLAIAKQAAAADSRIRVIQCDQHVGPIQNWNRSLRHIDRNSDYVKFVHADDWIFPECITEMVKVVEENPSVGVVGAYGLRGARVVWQGLPYPSTVTAGHEICRLRLLGKVPYVLGSPTSVLFRSDLVRKSRAFFNGHPFPQFMDQEVCYQILQNSDFGFVHQVLTFSRVHEQSVTSLLDTRLNQDLPAKLNILLKYGQIYLPNEAYQRRVKCLMNRYYRFLGGHIFRFSENRFREYHRNILKHWGCPLSLVKLTKGSLLELLDLLVTPKRLAIKAVHLTARVLHWVSRSTSSKSSHVQRRT